MELHPILLLTVVFQPTYIHLSSSVVLAQTEISLPFANPRHAFRMDANIHFNFRKTFSYTIVNVICYISGLLWFRNEKAGVWAQACADIHALLWQILSGSAAGRAKLHLPQE